MVDKNNTICNIPTLKKKTKIKGLKNFFKMVCMFDVKKNFETRNPE